jgi:hypothetical protein
LFIKIIKEQLTQGVSEKKLAQSITVGILMGCCPILGVTTGLAILLGHLLKLNHIVVQSVNYALYPLQILLIPLYIKVVSLGTSVGELSVRPDLVFKSFTSDYVLFLKQYGLVALYATVLWCFLSGILFFPLQKLFLIIVIKVKSKINK